jgi:hypothetical protein
MRNVELTTSLPPKRFLAAMAVCLGLIVLGGCSDESDSSAAGSSEADLILGGEPPMSPEAQARADWERADLNRADIAVTGSVSETSDTGATLELSVAVLDKESARGLNLVVYVVVRQLVWTRAAPAAWDHLGGVVEVGGVMMAGGAVDVKSGSVRPPSRSRRVAADGPAVGPGRMVRGGSDSSEWEGRFGPDGLGVGVPTMMPVVAVGGLAGDAESVADVGPAGAPVEGPGDRCVEGVLGSLFGGCGVDGGGECVGAESFGAVHQGCHLRVTR